ncbi:hypothetical protein [Terracoccus sp. 273MFTsu3.1]|uniref:hypothetical protein n=1 Tax=Terracoccus sp. 273MFTsu3.1 TaxID=1172188 RepID=UPI0003667711|nr:hypothetical protein [Terracoccus sp. 273MFTsu3.1]
MFLSVPAISAPTAAGRNERRMAEVRQSIDDALAQANALADIIRDVRLDLAANADALVADMDERRGPVNMTQHFANKADDVNRQILKVQEDMLRVLALAAGFEVTA